MRCLILGLCGLFLASTLPGCGAAAIPSAPGDAKAGPPPGTSDAWNKKADPAKKK